MASTIFLWCSLSMGGISSSTNRRRLNRLIDPVEVVSELSCGLCWITSPTPFWTSWQHWAGHSLTGCSTQGVLRSDTTDLSFQLSDSSQNTQLTLWHAHCFIAALSWFLHYEQVFNRTNLPTNRSSQGACALHIRSQACIYIELGYVSGHMDKQFWKLLIANSES